MPRSFTLPSRRYAPVAALLEYTIPGTGVMYAGQVRIGMVWLALTLLGDAAFLASMFVGFTGSAGDFSGVLVIVGFVLGITLFLWLIVRLAIVGSYVQEFNADAQRRWRRTQVQ